MSLPDTPTLSAEGRTAMERAARELADLASQPLLPEDFFAHYLRITIDAVKGLGGAIWLRNEQGAQLFAKHNLASSGYHAAPGQKRAMDRLLGSVFQEKTAYILAAKQDDLFSEPPEGEVENETAYPFFFYPIQVENRIVGVACIWLAEAGEPKTYPEYLRFLLATAERAAAFLGSLHGHTVALRLSQAGGMVRCLEDLVGVVEPSKIAVHATNRLQDFFRANRCTLFQKDLRDRWRLEMTSNQEAVDRRSQLVQSLCALAGLLAQKQEARVFARAGADDGFAAALDQLGIHHGACVFFSRRPGRALDGLLLVERFAPTPFPAETLHHLEWAGRQLERAFGGAAQAQDASIPVVSPVLRATRRGLRSRPRSFAAKVLLPVAALGLLAAIPVPLRISGDCHVLPQRMAVVAAEAEGRLLEVLAKEGDRVEAGQLLGRIDDRDISTQLAVARHEVQRWEAAAYSSHEKGEETQRGIAEINLARAVVSIDRLDYLQTRTAIVSPISGVVITKNLAHREGEAVQVGQVICEVANPDSYEVQVLVRQQDIGLVLRELENGGSLTVDLILHAFPHRRLTATVDTAAMVSQEATMQNGVSYFVLRAPFPLDSDLRTLLKPGYSGAAKVNLPRRSAGAVMIRRFWDYVRVRWTL